MLKSRFPQIIAASSMRAADVVEKAALRIEARAKGHSRVDTGYMRGGWQAHKVDQFTWEVFNPVDYSIHNEFGTIYMSPQPMAAPAIEETRPEFLADMAGTYV